MRRRTRVRTYGLPYGNTVPPADLPSGPQRKAHDSGPTAEKKRAEVERKNLKPGMKVSLGMNGSGEPAITDLVRRITPTWCLELRSGMVVSPFKVVPCGQRSKRQAKKIEGREAVHA